MPRARSADVTVPGPAQPGASLVLGGLWISPWSPTLKRPSPGSVARVQGARLARAIDVASIVRCRVISRMRHCSRLGYTSPPAGGSAPATQSPDA
eukprot:9500356-Pyramimonas_sp.AAC.1